MGSPGSEFLIRDSARNGARRLSGEAAGFGNPTPVLRGKQLATGSPNRHNGGGKSLEAVHPLSANGGYRPNSGRSGRAMSSGLIAPFPTPAAGTRSGVGRIDFCHSVSQLAQSSVPKYGRRYAGGIV